MVEIKKILHNKIYYYEQLDSTDLKALELAKQGAAEGTIVIAARQTAGRGRMRRKWESPEGKGLWFSMILRDPQTNDRFRILRPNNAADSRCSGESSAGTD